MQLFLIRHAHAVAAEEDSRRPLSPRGRGECARLAAFFRRNGALRPASIRHSPLARAEETARLLAAGLGLDAALVETAGLLPEDDPAAGARCLDDADTAGDLAIVGHEPQLSALATLLVCGRAQPAAFVLKKAAVLALAPDGGADVATGRLHWRVRWQIEPALLLD